MDAVVVNVISRFTTQVKANEIVAFFAANPLPSSSRRISQSVETIRSNAALGARLLDSALVTGAYWEQ